MNAYSDRVCLTIKHVSTKIQQVEAFNWYQVDTMRVAWLTKRSLRWHDCGADAYADEANLVLHDVIMFDELAIGQNFQTRYRDGTRGLSIWQKTSHIAAVNDLGHDGTFIGNEWVFRYAPTK